MAAFIKSLKKKLGIWQLHLGIYLREIIVIGMNMFVPKALFIVVRS